MLVNDWEHLIPVCNEATSKEESNKAIFHCCATMIGNKRSEWVILNEDANCKQHRSGSNLNMPALWIVITHSAETFIAFAINNIEQYPFINAGTTAYFFPLYCYNNAGKQVDNVIEETLELFNNHYRQNEPFSPVCYAGSSELRDEFKTAIPAANTINKEQIFHYVYAVLHHPAYRKKYELNLKREFPHIPLYHNFHQWAAWGKRLMDLHVHYETAVPYPLKRVDVVIEPKAGVPLDYSYKAKLKADKAAGEIEIDAFTTLSNIPSLAWDYKLGNRSALEWILDRYKEKKLGNPPMAEQFNTYRFHDHRERVINLLQRVCTISMETMQIIGEMP